MLTQSEAPGHVIGWTSFSHWHSMHRFCRNFQHCTGFVYYLFSSFYWVLNFLCVYSCHSILECYNLFSEVGLSMRSFCFISEKQKINRIFWYSALYSSFTLLYSEYPPQKLVSIKIFNSDLFITLSHIFFFLWIQWICIICYSYLFE